MPQRVSRLLCEGSVINDVVAQAHLAADALVDGVPAQSLHDGLARMFADPRRGVRIHVQLSSEGVVSDEADAFVTESVFGALAYCLRHALPPDAADALSLLLKNLAHLHEPGHQMKDFGPNLPQGRYHR